MVQTVGLDHDKAISLNTSKMHAKSFEAQLKPKKNKNSGGLRTSRSVSKSVDKIRIP